MTQIAVHDTFNKSHGSDFLQNRLLWFFFFKRASRYRNWMVFLDGRERLTPLILIRKIDFELVRHFFFEKIGRKRTETQYFAQEGICNFSTFDFLLNTT